MEWLHLDCLVMILTISVSIVANYNVAALKPRMTMPIVDTYTVAVLNDPIEAFNTYCMIGH